MKSETPSAMKLYSVVSIISLSPPPSSRKTIFLSLKTATQAVDLQTDQQQAIT